MAQKRGIIRLSSIFGLTLIYFFFFSVHLDVAKATEFNVGDNRGWSFNMQNWPKGHTFKTRDVLVFKYNPKIHNVYAVNANEYNSCSFSDGSILFESGNDRIPLGKGDNFFICGVPGHCKQGMKIAVHVE